MFQENTPSIGKQRKDELWGCTLTVIQRELAFYHKVEEYGLGIGGLVVGTGFRHQAQGCNSIFISSIPSLPLSSSSSSCISRSGVLLQSLAGRVKGDYSESMPPLEKLLLLCFESLFTLSLAAFEPLSASSVTQTSSLFTLIV